MKTYLCAVCAVAFLAPGLVAADENTQESAPIELNVVQMDQITAGSGFMNKGFIAWFSGTTSGVISGGATCPAGQIGALCNNFGSGSNALGPLTGGAGKSGGVFVPHNTGHPAP